MKLIDYIIKCTLIKCEIQINSYKGEGYMRAKLTFVCKFLGLFSFKKKIVYDVTMFENYESHVNYWGNAIENKSLVMYSAIKDNKIF